MSLAYSEQVWIWQWHGHDWYWWYAHCVATRTCQGWNQAVGLLSSKVRHKYWCNFFAWRVYRIKVSSRAIRTTNTHASELLHKEKRRSQNCRSSALHADHSAIPRLSGDMIQNNYFSDIALYNFLVCDTMNVHSPLQDASCKQGQSIRRCELAQVLTDIVKLFIFECIETGIDWMRKYTTKKVMMKLAGHGNIGTMRHM